MSVRRKIKVFLGGTCEGCYPESEWNNPELEFAFDWRKELVSMLDLNRVEYFNPVVDDWNNEAQQREIEYRENCDICLYTITDKMKGVYSIAEIIDDSNKRPDKTVFCNLYGNYLLKQDLQIIKSLDATAEMVIRNNGSVMRDLKLVANYLNNLEKPIPYIKKCKCGGKCKSRNKKATLGLYKYRTWVPGIGNYVLIVDVLGNDMLSTINLLNTTKDLYLDRRIFKPDFELIEFREIKKESDIIEPVIIDHKIERDY